MEILTVDKLTMRMLGALGQHPQLLESWKVNDLLKQDVAQAPFDETPEQQQTIGHMGLDYLAQEIYQMIIARQLDTLGEYLVANSVCL